MEKFSINTFEIKTLCQNDFRMTSGWLQDDSEHTESIKQAFREHLRSTQRAREQSDLVIHADVKIK